MDIQCCHSEFDGCFKRTGRAFAMCRPMAFVGECVDDDAWTCPESWIPSPPPPRPPPGAPAPPPRPPCTDNFAPCGRSQCCADASFACYKRNGKMFAQCRPRRELFAGDVCTDTDMWLCPSYWEPPPRPPAPRPPPALSPPPRAARPRHCKAPYEACFAAAGAPRGTDFGPGGPPLHCCDPDGAGRPFTCRPKLGGAMYAQCRPLDPAGHCVEGDGWGCAQSPPPLAPTAPPDSSLEIGGCRRNFQSCWLGGEEPLACCADGMPGNRPFGCFRRPGKSFALCRPWPEGACVSDEWWECPEAPPPKPPNPPPPPPQPPRISSDEWLANAGLGSWWGSGGAGSSSRGAGASSAGGGGAANGNAHGGRSAAGGRGLKASTWLVLIVMVLGFALAACGQRYVYEPWCEGRSVSWSDTKADMRADALACPRAAAEGLVRGVARGAGLVMARLESARERRGATSMTHADAEMHMADPNGIEMRLGEKSGPWTDAGRADEHDDASPVPSRTTRQRRDDEKAHKCAHAKQSCDEEAAAAPRPRVGRTAYGEQQAGNTGGTRKAPARKADAIDMLVDVADDDDDDDGFGAGRTGGRGQKSGRGATKALAKAAKPMKAKQEDKKGLLSTGADDGWDFD